MDSVGRDQDGVEVVSIRIDDPRRDAITHADELDELIGAASSRLSGRLTRPLSDPGGEHADSDDGSLVTPGDATPAVANDAEGKGLLWSCRIGCEGDERATWFCSRTAPMHVPREISAVTLTE